MMTPEELGKGPVDETMRQRVRAIAQETYRRRLEQTHPGHPIDAPTVMMAIEIALSGWTPPEPVVDPDVLAFLKWHASHPLASFQEAYIAGVWMARKQEQERAKVLDEYLADLETFGPDDSLSSIPRGARAARAKYWGEA